MFIQILHIPACVSCLKQHFYSSEILTQASFKLHTQKYSYHILITLKHTRVTFKQILITLKYVFSDERVDTFYDVIIYLSTLISSYKTLEEILTKCYKKNRAAKNICYRLNNWLEENSRKDIDKIRLLENAITNILKVIYSA